MTTPSKFAAGHIWYGYSEAECREPMANRSRGPLGLLKLTAVVAEAGCTLPPEFVALRNRFQSFSQEAASGTPDVIADRLIQSLRSGSSDPHSWFAASMAQHGPGATEARAEVLSMVHTAIEQTMRELYMPVARDHYRQLSGQFNHAAEQFTRAANTVSPDADPAAVIGAGRKTVEAWHAALTHADELDRLLPALVASAELVRPVTLPTGLGVDRGVFELPLAADVTSQHPRVVWAAWKDLPEPQPLNPDTPAAALSAESMTAERPDTPQGTRGGAWTRLVRCGATIRACPVDQLATLPLFGQPQPIAIVPVWDGHQRRHVLTRRDPHGELPNPATHKRAPLARLRDTWRRGEPTSEAEPNNIYDTVALDDTQGDRP